MNEADACDKCLARTWLLARLAGHLDRHRDRLDALLELDAGDLIAALAGEREPPSNASSSPSTPSRPAAGQPRPDSS